VRENPTARARRVWDDSAQHYDRQIGFLDRHWFGGGREWACSRATGAVLEVAVGTGLNLPYYPAGVQLTGVDLSPAMLDIARKRARELGREVDLREADASALPFADATFDTVVCTLALCAIPDHVAAVAEMVRVLSPGGQVLLLDHIGSSWWPVWAVQRLAETVSIRIAGEHYTRRPAVLLGPAGLTIVESQRLKLGSVERVRARKAE
jgi:ubiquinone/menaquinone biosynthesis C-methylase UbiE